jgi:hypothetical protein
VLRLTAIIAVRNSQIPHVVKFKSKLLRYPTSAHDVTTIQVLMIAAAHAKSPKDTTARRCRVDPSFNEELTAIGIVNKINSRLDAALMAGTPGQYHV